MYKSASIALVLALKAYALIGVMFASAFVTFGISRIDPNAHKATLGFRVLVFPGSLAMWPLLLSRWARGMHEPPIEGNPHQ
jgi:hypothetical protein